MIQTLLRQSQDSDAAALARHMQVATDCLQNMFETMLELCRLEAGLQQPIRTAIAAGPFCARVLDDVRQSGVAPTRRFAGSFADATILSDKALLTKLVRNLLLNVVAWTIDQEIAVAGSRREHTYELEISAICTSLVPALRERAFIELKRGAADRPMPTYAVGVATLRRYAACLGHPLEVRVGADHRLVLTLELPLAARADRAPHPVNETR